MLCTLLGVGRSKGTYEGYTYDNATIWVLPPDDTRALVGVRPFAAKINWDKYNTYPWVSQLCKGDLLDLTFDRFGRVCAIEYGGR